ncbi:MAG: DnaD domain protein [Eubacteriales bacterium]
MKFTTEHPLDALSSLPATPALADASAEDMRVLLCLLARGTALSHEALARDAGCSVSRVVASLAYWEGCGVLARTAESPAGGPPADGGPRTKTPLRPARDLHPATAEENATYIDKHDMQGLLDECQRTAGRLFNSTEVGVVVGLHQQLGLEDGYILTLLAYCVKLGKNTMKYVERTAYGLFEEGIDTLPSLEEYLRRKERAAAEEGKLRRLLGIGERALSKKEAQCFLTWTAEFGYGMEIIGAAFDIAVNQTGKAGVSYIDKILTRWHEAGCRTLAQVEAQIEADRQNRPAPRKPLKKAEEKAGSFDTDEFFQKALERSYGKKDDGSI